MMTNGNDPIGGTKTVQRTDFDGLGVGVYDVEIPSSLTKREYFAATAMNGLLSVQNLVIDIGKDSTVFKIVSKNAVKYADALIAALNTPEAQ